MSIRTNPMKAVPVLLKRVKTARTIFMQNGIDDSFDGKLKKLTRQLNMIENVFMKVKNNQDALLDTLHDVDSHLRNLDRTKLDHDMDGICRRIRDCAHKLLPMDSFESESSDDYPSSPQQYNNQLLLPQPPPINLEHLQRVMVDNPLREFLLSLLIFPVNAVIKKRQAIYLWIGMWPRGEEDEVCEDLIDTLLRLNLIVAHGNGKCPIVNKFKLNPHFRPQLESFVKRENAERLGYYLTIPNYGTSLVLTQQKVTLGQEVRMKRIVFNSGASYLNFGSQSSDKGTTSILNVLQLGRWQDSPSHHIEVGSQEFLKHLSNLKYLKYLSLHGMSRIFELPPSIAQLERLEILDLKACHNLETLPDDISTMKNLTHLILSECYMLDGMPKGIEKLANLQVLKGFIIGSSINIPYRISDLAKLRRLRRLSIHIATEAVINDGDFESLGEFPALEHLKISWGVSDTRYSDIKIILPSSLKKLHLQGFRGQRIPEWLKPGHLHRELKELNITGGKLASMNHDEDMNQWDMEIVRLKYLKYLGIDLTNLKMLFPRLRYALMKPIPNHSYIEWSND